MDERESRQISFIIKQTAANSMCYIAIFFSDFHIILRWVNEQWTRFPIVKMENKVDTELEKH